MATPLCCVARQLSTSRSTITTCTHCLSSIRRARTAIVPLFPSRNCPLSGWTALAPGTQCRRHTLQSGGAAAAAGGAAARGATQRACDQFQSSQMDFHRHSFHEKGSGPHRRGGEGCRENSSQSQSSSSSSSSSFFSAGVNRNEPRTSSDEHRSNSSNGNTNNINSSSGGSRDGGEGSEDCGYAGPDAGTSRAEQFAGSSGGGKSTSATAQERRDASRRWENAFFARVHFDEGMRDRFRGALDAEEHEQLTGMTNAQLFPDWAPDEEAPPHLFMRLSPAMQLRYILNRLSMGERRIRYAPDYGSLSMMYQLNLGERMVKEAEDLLWQLGWMNEELEERLEEMKAIAVKIKYDYDLD